MNEYLMDLIHNPRKCRCTLLGTNWMDQVLTMEKLGKRSYRLGANNVRVFPMDMFNLTWSHYEHALLERISCNNSCAPRNMRVSLPLKHAKPEYEKDRNWCANSNKDPSVVRCCKMCVSASRFDGHFPHVPCTLCSCRNNCEDCQ